MTSSPHHSNQHSSTPNFQDSDHPTNEPGLDRDRPETESGGPAAGSSTLRSPSGGRIEKTLPVELQNDYECLADLGGDEHVFMKRARHRKTCGEVAIKVYTSIHSFDANSLERFASLSSEDVIKCTHAASNTAAWEIQQYYPLGSLGDLAKRHGGKLPEKLTLDVIAKMADALDRIHSAGLIHGDLKPANILVRSERPLKLILGGFGLSRSLLMYQQNTAKLGTLHYAAPEVLRRQASAALDWFSLGVIVHHLYTGSHIFTNPRTKKMFDDVTIHSQLINCSYSRGEVASERWSLLFAGLLTSDPQTRWGAEQVRRWLDGGSPDVVGRDPRSKTSPNHTITPVSFIGNSYTDPGLLFREMARDWQHGVEALTKPGVSNLAKATASLPRIGPKITSTINDVRAERLDPGLALLWLQIIAQPNEVPLFRGIELSKQSVLEMCARTREGDQSAGEWLARVRLLDAMSVPASQASPSDPIYQAAKDLATWKQPFETALAHVGTTIGYSGGPRGIDVRSAVRSSPQYEGLLFAMAFADRGERLEITKQVDDLKKQAQRTPHLHQNVSRILEIAASSPGGEAVAVVALGSGLAEVAKSQAHEAALERQDIRDRWDRLALRTAAFRYGALLTTIPVLGFFFYSDFGNIWEPFRRFAAPGALAVMIATIADLVLIQFLPTKRRDGTRYPVSKLGFNPYITRLVATIVLMYEVNRRTRESFFSGYTDILEHGSAFLDFVEHVYLAVVPVACAYAIGSLIHLILMHLGGLKLNLFVKFSKHRFSTALIFAPLIAWLIMSDIQLAIAKFVDSTATPNPYNKQPWAELLQIVLPIPVVIGIWCLIAVWGLALPHVRQHLRQNQLKLLSIINWVAVGIFVVTLLAYPDYSGWIVGAGTVTLGVVFVSGVYTASHELLVGGSPK